MLARGKLLTSAVTSTVPAYMESQAYLVTRYLSQMGLYQLSTTWPLYTEDEVRTRSGELDTGPVDLLAPFVPGSSASHAHTYVTLDERHNYVSGRFWGDVYLLGQVFAERVEAYVGRK